MLIAEGMELTLWRKAEDIDEATKAAAACTRELLVTASVGVAVAVTPHSPIPALPSLPLASPLSILPPIPALPQVPTFSSIPVLAPVLGAWVAIPVALVLVVKEVQAVLKEIDVPVAKIVVLGRLVVKEVPAAPKVAEVPAAAGDLHVARVPSRGFWHCLSELVP